jgi:mannosylfructose-phosphate synthase
MMFKWQRPRLMFVSTHGYVAAHPELGRADTGGQVVYVLELAKALGRMGFTVDIFTRRFGDQPSEEPVGVNVRIVRIPCGGPEFIAKEVLWRQLDEWADNVVSYVSAARLRYQLVNSHYWDAGYAACILGSRMKLAHIHTPHSLGSWKRSQMSEAESSRKEFLNYDERIDQERKIYRRARMVIATTQQQASVLVGTDYRVTAEKVRTVPAGYDNTRFFPIDPLGRLRAKERLGWNRPTVLALGRIAANKGYDLLLRAMPTVIARIPQARLVLAIGGRTQSPQEHTDLNELNCLAGQLRIADHVQFDGQVSDEALPDYYRAADVFALSSRYEPFGMTAIEAMACGTPTVVTTEGGLCDELQWGLNAIYADPRDSAEFGHALCCVLRQPQVADRLSRLGPELTQSTFTWQKVAQRFRECAVRVGSKFYRQTRHGSIPVYSFPSQPFA